MSDELILMRHAKSDHDDPRLSDHDRPLNPRGRRDAPRMAMWLQSIDSVPDLILSSSSQRTRETASLMMECWSGGPELVLCESLYLSTPQTMLMTIQSEHRNRSRVMVLAHNPGISMVASMLASQMLSMPTAAICVLQCSKPRGSGDEVEHVLGDLSERSTVTLAHYMVPKQLES